MSRCIVVLLAIAACGGSSTTPPKTDGKMPDSKPIDAKIPDAGLYDFGCGGNTACTLDKVCCSMPGPNTTFSCVAAGSCAAADQINCDGPDECGGTTPTCCGVYAGDGTGNYPQCGVKTLGTSCTATSACPTHLESTCNDTTKVQICHVSTECTDQTYNKCCTFTNNGAMISFCIDSFTASAAGATCN